MTKNEFFSAVISAEISDEMTAYAQEQLDKDAAAKERRKAQPTKAQKANAPLREFALAFLDTQKATAKELTSAYNHGKDESEQVTSNRFTAVCGRLVTEGLVSATDIKALTATGNMGKCKQYALVDDGE